MLALTIFRKPFIYYQMVIEHKLKFEFDKQNIKKKIKFSFGKTFLMKLLLFFV